VKGNWKANWNVKFTAKATNDWLRAGVGRGAVVVEPPVVIPPVVVPPVVPPTVPPIETTSQVSVAQVGEYVVLVIAGKKPTPEQLAKIQEAVLGVLN
jgi:hypothetical protein